ncbi:Homeobox protein cut-like 1 [Bienertia sinuspersici]
MKSKVAQLELLIEMTGKELSTKSLHIEKCEKKIDELSHTILRLESIMFDLKDATDEEIIKVFEKQVQELQADVRRNDLNIHQLKVVAKDDEKTVNLLASKVETMAKIIPELWFHVQKLEQAREVIERRTMELQRRLRNEKCTFFKFINKFPGKHYQTLVVLYTSEAFNQLRRSYSAVKKYHHQLQGFVKQEMERNEFTAVVAGEELIFFLVSVVIVFPFILAVRWLLSVFFLASSVVVCLFTLVLRLLSSVPFLAASIAVFSAMLALR